jgi:hypothetical protein
MGPPPARQPTCGCGFSVEALHETIQQRDVASEERVVEAGQQL